MSSINQTFFFFHHKRLPTNTNTIYDIIGVATCAKETKCLGPKVECAPSIHKQISGLLFQFPVA